MRVLVLRLPDQLAWPVMQLAPSGVGDRIHGTFRALTVAGGFLPDDETSLGELLDHHVQRAVVELDAARVTVVAQGAAHLVRMHRGPGQIGKHSHRKQVAYLPPPAHTRSLLQTHHLVTPYYPGSTNQCQIFNAASPLRSRRGWAGLPAGK